MGAVPNSQLPSPASHILGIRHHGPGSARSVQQALERLQPDMVLVEGPPDAAAVLPLLAHPAMRPPVALLLYEPDAPRNAVYYPFAVFSPEWRAIHYALTHAVPVRFMDLPQRHAPRPARHTHIYRPVTRCSNSQLPAPNSQCSIPHPPSPTPCSPHRPPSGH